jgi:ribosomal protein S27AE
MIFGTSLPVNTTAARLGASEARTAAREALTEVEALRFDVERLMLITEALWHIAKERLECTDEDLVRRIHDIDLEDGKLDGRKATSPPRPCPHCQRILAKHRPLCLYCGKPVEFVPFER